MFSAVSLADLHQREALYRKQVLTTTTTRHFSACFVLFPALSCTGTALRSVQ
jgi:hypothetical protein